MKRLLVKGKDGFYLAERKITWGWKPPVGVNYPIISDTIGNNSVRIMLLGYTWTLI